LTANRKDAPVGRARESSDGPRGSRQPSPPARDTALSMSHENVEVVGGVRTRVTISNPTRRSLDERILFRFLLLFRAMAIGWSWLPPQSRLRRAVTAGAARMAAEAANRGDFDLLLLGPDPAIEYELPQSLVTGYVPPDLVGVHRGHEGYLRMWKALTEVWEGVTLEPDEIIDFGDRLLTAGRLTAHARHTGIALDTPMFQLVTLRHGLVVRGKDFLDREQAFEAAGLRE
jgi:ketosteroid isomerase-like protein